MKKYFDKNKLMATIAISAALAMPTMAMAKVNGNCGSCHTMHNSQDSASMSYVDGGGLDTFVALNPTEGDDTTPNGSLLRYGCVGCHTGTFNTTDKDVPIVNGAADPTTSELAAGNFYWVGASGDNYGHNVLYIDGQDGEHVLTAPGAAAAMGSQLTCAGTLGCHGDAGDSDQFESIAGGHHGSGADVLTSDADKVYTSGANETTDMSYSYRMLAGVAGIEDDDWEYTKSLAATGADHNVYVGEDRTGNTAPTSTTMSALCGRCHTDFHNGEDSITAGTTTSPWVRHPTDVDLSVAAGEYASYVYSLTTPAATTKALAASMTFIDDDNLAANGAGKAIVMCLSCHRAHASKYPDMLRWNYVAQEDSHSSADDLTITGCYACHTTKDNV